VLNGNGIIALVAKLKLTSDPSDQRYILETFASLSKNEKKRYVVLYHGFSFSFEFGFQIRFGFAFGFSFGFSFVFGFGFWFGFWLRFWFSDLVLVLVLVPGPRNYSLISRPFLARQEIQELLIPFLTSGNEPLMNAAQTILNNLR
jgi:hypothetical protein